MRTRFELADVIRRWGDAYQKDFGVSNYNRKVLDDILKCRTAVLGGHVEQCDSCGNALISYNSCGNRHCPKCQALQQAIWAEALLDIILPVKHYHMIFTVPHELNAIALSHSRWFYNCLFSKAWETLQSFGLTNYGVETGAVMILHTWGQNLSFHPHVHCIVPAVGLTVSGKTKLIGQKGRYLFPIKAVSALFKGKMLVSIRKILERDNAYRPYKKALEDAWNKKWNLYCEPSLGKPEHVVGYLGQYTHRVAITNDRIEDINETGVRFIHKDYRNGARKKTIELHGVEFLRRFCQHILPRRFVKIRYYGIYSSRFRTLSPGIVKLKAPVKQESSIERIKRLTGVDICRCPVCKIGVMQTIGEIPRIRSPGYLQAVSLKSL
jgi:hypothetical protein